MMRAMGTTGITTDADVLHLPTRRALATLDVAELTDARTYARGASYLRGGRVVIEMRQARFVEAAVRGTERYQVRLAFDRRGLEHSCTCPAAADGAFCKHLVAVALTLATTAADGDADADDGSDGGSGWEERAAEVIDAVEDLLATGRPADVVAFCERAGACLEDGAAEIADDEALGRLAERLVRLRRQARRQMVSIATVSM